MPQAARHLNVKQILAWADAHHKRTGKWPKQRSGPVHEVDGLSWIIIHGALYNGSFGLPGNSSLAQLLQRHRGVENRARLPNLAVAQVIKWAKLHRKQTGDWPHKRSGEIAAAPEFTWKKINSALRAGSRGLPRNTTLAQLIEERADGRTGRTVPPLSIRQILKWVDEHRERTRRWPTNLSGPVHGQTRQTWGAIDRSLRVGTRGLPGGSSLFLLLVERRDKQTFRKWDDVVAGLPDQRTGRRFSRKNRGAQPRSEKSPRKPQPALTLDMILEWADDQHRRTGRWPEMKSGPVSQFPAITWGNIDFQLRPRGRIRIDGARSLHSLLKLHRGVWRAGRGMMTEQQIVEWAQAHKRLKGEWPRSNSGAIPEAPQETWRAMDWALLHGSRGLKRRSSLMQLIRAHRTAQGEPQFTNLTVQQVLQWADKHRARTGNWPASTSGQVLAFPTLTWQAVHALLHKGGRGLPGSTTLVQFLQKHRGRPNQSQLPKLSIPQIVAWAREHLERTGAWPHSGSGQVRQSPQENWKAIDSALWDCTRGLRGPSTLAKVLARHAGKRDSRNPPRLTVSQILKLADQYHKKKGRWPKTEAGPIEGIPGESWWTVNDALKRGIRGLRGRTRLLGLLAKHRGVRDPRNPPKLTQKQILAWADAHYEATGDWPSSRSDHVIGQPDERWSAINHALVNGRRGLNGGWTLVRLLSRFRPEQYRRRGIPLNIDQILEWITVHHEMTGQPPSVKSGMVIDEPGENWKAIDAALRAGSRNLRGRSSLERLIASRYHAPYKGIGQSLSIEKIVTWAVDFKKRVGAWPTNKFAYVFPRPHHGERWSVIDRCLREGGRGLRGGSSLQKVLSDRRTQRV